MALSTWSRRAVIGGVGASALGFAAYKLLGRGGSAYDGRSRAQPVACDATPPPKSDVVIIGGGIIGVCAAYYLAKRGIEVTLCEKGAIAGEASGRSVGQVGSAGLDPAKMPLLQSTKALWKGINEEIQGETGYRANGYVSVFSNDEQQGYWESWSQSVAQWETEAKLLNASQTNGLVGFESPWRGAYYNPTDGCAEPTLAAPAIATAAMRLGAKMVAPCAVRGLETQGGRVSGVVTEKGTIRTSNVILAGGCWSSLFAEREGVKLPTLNIFAMNQSVYGVDGPPGTGDSASATWRKQIDGGYTVSVVGGLVPLVPAMLRYGLLFREALFEAHWDNHLNLSDYFFKQLQIPRHWDLNEVSPFERMRILEPTHNPRLVEQALRELSRDVPAFRNAKVKEVWSGALVAPPDNVPTMSSVQALPGLYLATGFSYGLTMAPAVGKLMAELVAGDTPHFDPRPYRYERYIDGTELHFTP